MRKSQRIPVRMGNRQKQPMKAPGKVKIMSRFSVETNVLDEFTFYTALTADILEQVSK